MSGSSLFLKITLTIAAVVLMPCAHAAKPAPGKAVKSAEAQVSLREVEYESLESRIGSNLVIHTTIAFQVNKTFRRNIIHKPADLIGMRLYHHFKRLAWINNTHRRTIRIGKKFIHIILQVIDSQALASTFKAYR